MSFAWPWCFLLLPLPWLVRKLWPSVTPGIALRVPQLPVAARAAASVARRSWPSLLVWVLLLVAVARPQTPSDDAPYASRGNDLMLVLDVSASMATADLGLNGKAVPRLHAARLLADNFLQQRRGDRAGLIVFGQQAYLHTPLSFDLDAVGAALASVETGLAGKETALGDAIALGVKYLKSLPDRQRVLVLLTDGANTAGTLAPQRAAWLAARAGVRVHALGIGSSAVGALDERTLRDVSAQTGGAYLRATDAVAIERFFRQLAQLEPVRQASDGRTAMREQYVWPLAGALLVLAWLMLRRMRGSPACP